MRSVDAARSLPVARCLVACNIYVSVGHSRWANFLLDLLTNAQEECRRLRNSSTTDSLAIVHAYADGQYDRSSFHLAGSSPLVAHLASYIAVNAVTGLHALSENRTLEKSSLDHSNLDEIFATPTAHPAVGLVDHVAVLPLTLDPDNELPSSLTVDEWTRSLQQQPLVPERDTNKIFPDPLYPLTPSTSSGWVARTVGMALQQAGVDVLWYGHADPLNTPLAHVRKAQTRFFEALPSCSSSESSTTTTPPSFLGQSAVGAPTQFVENYNIQLWTTHKPTASSLTRWIRSRDGGLPFVEALTLPHGQHPVTKEPFYEVACNLLHPSVTSVDDVEKRIQEWTTKTKYSTHPEKTTTTATATAVEYHAYRVGTTIDMCRNALEMTKTVDQEMQYNHHVRNEFERFLQQPK